MGWFTKCHKNFFVFLNSDLNDFESKFQYLVLNIKLITISNGRGYVEVPKNSVTHNLMLHRNPMLFARVTYSEYPANTKTADNEGPLFLHFIVFLEIKFCTSFRVGG